MKVIFFKIAFLGTFEITYKSGWEGGGRVMAAEANGGKRKGSVSVAGT